MQDTNYTAEIRNVLHPVSDVGAATRFYAQVFGFERKFADGDRYAALGAGGITLAIAGPEESLTAGPAASIKVIDIAEALKALIREGGTVVREPEEGPHEVRAVAQDPWGNVIVIYSPR